MPPRLPPPPVVDSVGQGTCTWCQLAPPSVVRSRTLVLSGPVIAIAQPWSASVKVIWRIVGAFFGLKTCQLFPPFVVGPIAGPDWATGSPAERWLIAVNHQWLASR